MKTKVSLPTNSIAAAILGEIQTLNWLNLGIQNIAALKKLAKALRAGELDEAAMVCGDFKGNFRHRKIDKSLRNWQARLWDEMDNIRRGSQV